MRAFYLLGLSPYKPKGNDRAKLFSNFTKFIQGFACLSIAPICLYHINVEVLTSYISPGEAIALNVCVLCDISRTTTILLQCLLFKDSMDDIMCMFQSIDLHFVQYFHHRICYDNLSKASRFKFSAMLGVSLLYICSFVVRYISQDKATAIGLLAKVLQFMSSLTYVFVIFYVDLLNFYVTQLCLVIHNDTARLTIYLAHAFDSKSECSHNKLIRQQLEYYKIIHFQLWTVNQQINKYFGYSLMALMLNAFCGAVYSGLWTFQQVHFAMDYELSVWSRL